MHPPMRTGSVLELGLLEAGFSEQIRLKELEGELRRLELKEKDHLPFRGEKA